MTDDQIKKQIEAIRNATKEALGSKKTAKQFLIDAGIINPKKSTQAPNKTPYRNSSNPHL